MKQIPLTKGQVALVDDEDFEKVICHKWFASWNKGTKSFYAIRRSTLNGKKIAVSMHRYLLGLEYGDKLQVDHSNHDTLDNRRCNITVVDRRKNHHNRRDQSNLGPGIFYSKACPKNPFRVQVRHNRKRLHVGYFSSQEEAVLARDEFVSTLSLDARDPSGYNRG